ncbi:phospholipase D1, partial [Trichuris trichiura]
VTEGRHNFRSLYEDVSDKQYRDYFIPNAQLSCKVLKADDDVTGRKAFKFCILLTYLLTSLFSRYTIELEHGGHCWTVRRRFRDFFSLHNHILLHKAKRNFIPRRKYVLYIMDQPDRSSKIDIKQCAILTHGTLMNKTPTDVSPLDGVVTLKHGSVGSLPSSSSTSSSDDNDLPPFPVWPNIFHDRSEPLFTMLIVQEKLNSYLNAVLQNIIYRNLKETRDFIEVSRYSFVTGLGQKRKEGLLKKRPGGRQAYGGIIRCCTEMFASWTYRFFFLKDTYLAYAHPESEDVRAVMLFDPGFHVKLEEEYKKPPYHTLCPFKISTLAIKCKTKEDALAWERAISTAVSHTGKEFLQSNAYGSTYPVRMNSYGMWFVDGKDFMENLANMIELAEEEIFITDWWLSPEIYLKRPAIEGRRWRLDELLKRKAEQGVHVYVLLYKEVQIALGIKSLYSKRRLRELHPNIHVLRHPDHLPGSGVFLWAHHEKIVVIDQNIAFVGGIDLCYGRWDDSEHRLTDFGSVTFVTKKTATIVQKNEKSVMSAFRSVSRMLPVVSMRAASEEQADLDVIDGAQALSSGGHTVFFKSLLRHCSDFKCVCLRLVTLQQEDDVDSGLLGGGKYWIGKDYVNFIFKDFTAIDLPYNGTLCRSYARKANALARYSHCCQRCFALFDSKNIRENSRTSNVSRHIAQMSRSGWPICSFFIFPSSGAYLKLLRSACPWSVGNNMMEASIHRAYVGLIENAKHYIYIENQFFVTMLDRTDVQNSIAKALYDRIVQAHKKKEAFRVYVLLPLLPGFEGQVGTTGGSALQAVLYWTYQSISKGPHSLLENLSREIEDPSQYIIFCSLRTHGVLLDKMVTELIYIHSKLMIVDDRWTIVGSANINDRSMLGKRDSEVAVIVEDAEFEASKMNGQDYFAGKFARSLRHRLFYEHLGLRKKNSPSIDISDPSSERFFSLWKGIARKNTDIYEKVFCCIPTDEAKTFEQVKQYKGRLKLSDYDEASAKALLDDLTGNLVLFPLSFLCNSDLSPSYMTKEGLAPTSLFT